MRRPTAESCYWVRTLVYFATYRLGNAELAGQLFALLVGAIVVLTPAWLWVARRTSKRFVWMVGGLIGAAAGLVLWGYDGQAARIVSAIFLASSIGTSAIPFTFCSMIPDTVEYGEWRTGARSEGSIFGVVSLAQKVALGVAVGAVGVALNLIGYQPNLPQTETAITGLHAMVSLAPAGFGLAGVFLIGF